MRSRTIAVVALALALLETFSLGAVTSEQKRVRDFNSDSLAPIRFTLPEISKDGKVTAHVNKGRVSLRVDVAEKRLYTDPKNVFDATIGASSSKKCEEGEKVIFHFEKKLTLNGLPIDEVGYCTSEGKVLKAWLLTRTPSGEVVTVE
jgi:hypothetical protein